ncbi:Shr3 amino acid permease chaperone [Mucidula mucida]|nr:Shr3 amino acid permease chaperone [Mucidula mucida]
MGFRSSLVVCVTSFLLGSLFTHWTADSLTLWKSPVTDEHLWTAASYYSILANGPAELYYVLAVIVGIGAITILLSLRDGEAGNLMFDGGSIFLFGTTISMYLYSVVPVVFSSFTSLPTHKVMDPFPKSLRSATLDLASSNLICSVALTGVLALQAGRFWAETYDVDTEISESDSEESKQSRSRGKTPVPT